MTEPTLTKRCTRCGGEFPDEALFCPTCGEPQSRSSEDPLLGKVLAERYLLVERIGQGGSGTVYRAEHVTLRRKAAVKILHHQLCSDDSAIERFRREAVTVAAIENEHILDVLDFGRAEDGRLYFAMELLEGATLAAVLRREQRLAVDRAGDLMTQIGEALMEAHGMGYIHRDLRPRNIFLSRKHGRDDFVKLLDFGLAKLVHQGGEAHQTSLGMTFGDPRYMSPEQARGAPVDRRADIYSLGIVGYEMVTGQPPFAGGPTFQLLTKHLEEPPPPPSQLRPDLPPYFERVLLTALAKKRDERFVTVLRMIEALKDGAAEHRAHAPAAGTVAPAWPAEPGLRPKEYPAQGGAVGPVAVTDASPTEKTTTEPPPVDVAPPAAIPPALDPPLPAGPNALSELPTGRTLTYMPKAKASAQPPAVRPSAQQPAVRPSAQQPAVRPSGARPVAAPAGGQPPPAPNGPAAPTAASGATPPPSMSRQWFAQGDAGVDSLTEVTASRARMRGARSPAARLGLWAGVSLAAIALATGAVWLWVNRDVPPPRAPAVAPPAGDAGPAGAIVPAVAAGDAGVPVAAPPRPDGARAPTAASARPGAAGGRAPAPPARERPARAPGATHPPREARPQEPREPKPPTEPTAPRPPKDPTPGESPPAGADPAAVQRHLAAGRDLLRRGAHAGAAAEFLAVREVDARNADAIAGLGEVAFEQGHYQEAAVHLKAAVRLQPRRPGFHVLLGNSYYKLGRTKDAITEYRAALKIKPDGEEARHALEVAERRLKEGAP